jgi:hypothetical protein
VRSDQRHDVAPFQAADMLRLLCAFLTISFSLQGLIKV